MGYGAHPHTGDGPIEDEVAAYRRRLAAGIALTIPVLILTFLAPAGRWNDALSWALTTVILLYPGWPFFRGALRAARHGSTTMDTLIAVGASAAYALSVAAVLSGSPDRYFDTAAVIVTLVLVGKMLEARARMAAGDASRALLERGATEARILTDDGERTIPIDELRPGMLAVVLPGEKIPADGVIREGASWVDLSLLTGESVPVDVVPGDDVVGASINGLGRIVVFVTTVGANTRLSGIVRLLQAAQGSKAPVQRLADRVSAVFVPGRARDRGGDVRRLDALDRCGAEPGAAARDGGARDRVSVRARAGDAGRRDGRHRPRRRDRDPVQRRRGLRARARRRRRAAGQDRHVDRGRDDGGRGRAGR